MEITSLITIEIFLSFLQEIRSHLIQVAFHMSRERKDYFSNMAPEQWGIWEYKDPYLLPQNKIIFQVNHEWNQ